MPRRSSLWSVSGIQHPAYPGFTVRVVESKPNGPLVVYWWEKKGSSERGRQRGRGLGGLRRAALGSTPSAQRTRAEEEGRKFIAGYMSADVPSTGPLTLGTLCAEYEQRGLAQVSKDYRRDAVNCVKRVRDALDLGFVVSSLKPSHVEQYLVARAASGPVAGRRDMVALNIACNWALGEELLSANPFANPKLKRLLHAKHTPTRPFCSPEEFAALVAVAPRVVETVVCRHEPTAAKNHRPDERRRRITAQQSAAAFPTLLQLAWHTGHRISAILSLRWDAVDFTARPAAPFGTVTWYAGVVADRKKYEHTVPMNEPTRKALLAWRDESPVQSIARWVFPFLPSDRAISYNEVRRWLRDAISLAKMPKKRLGGWHMFRRGFATARKGMPLRDLASVGGWRDTETLMKSYVHATTEGTLKVALYSA